MWLSLFHDTDKFTFDYSAAVKSAINAFLELTETEKDRKSGISAVHGLTGELGYNLVTE